MWLAVGPLNNDPKIVASFYVSYPPCAVTFLWWEDCVPQWPG